ncbi:hypothetical protein SLA2020_529290 [Shorea laevis]
MKSDFKIHEESNSEKETESWSLGDIEEIQSVQGAFNRSAEISASEEERDDDMAMMDDVAERNDVEYNRGLEGEVSCADNINEENRESGNRAFINPDGSKENTISQDKASSKVEVS